MNDSEIRDLFAAHASLIEKLTVVISRLQAQQNDTRNRVDNAWSVIDDLLRPIDTLPKSATLEERFQSHRITRERERENDSHHG